MKSRVRLSIIDGYCLIRMHEIYITVVFNKKKSFLSISISRIRISDSFGNHSIIMNEAKKIKGFFFIQQPLFPQDRLIWVEIDHFGFNI